MKYIKIENNQFINYSMEQFNTDYPAIIHNMENPDTQILARHNVYHLVTTNPPTPGETQTVEESTPIFLDGEWYQTWTTRDLTEEEVNEIIATRTPIPADPEIALEFFASEELITQRSELCNSCPSYSKLKICAECNCIMPLKVKLKSTVCPIGKW